MFLAGNPEGTPLALTHNLKHNKTLHQRVILLTVLVEEIPFIEKERRVAVTDWGKYWHTHVIQSVADLPALIESEFLK